MIQSTILTHQNFYGRILTNTNPIFRYKSYKKRIRPLIYSTKKNFISEVPSVHVNERSNYRALAWWMLGCGGLVAGMISVGGATRITRSGLSMVEWKPHGSLPPLTNEDWEIEFNKYKKYPEFQQRNNMTLTEFKSIYWWEYGHRMMGRVIGVAFTFPLIYFIISKKIPKDLYKRFGLLFGLGATQGGIGWWMVKSGLSEPQEKRKEIRVSAYRLATHLGFAFATYSTLLWTAFDLLSRNKNLKQIQQMMDPIIIEKAKNIKKLTHVTAGILAITILSGAFVAGTDAGMAYNTFPKMGDYWIPPDLFDLKPFYKNIFENTSTIQFDHRMLAYSTLTGVLLMTGYARQPNIWKQLPLSTKNAMNLTLGLTCLQVTLGITTVLMHVPIPIALCHQAGAIGLLSSVLYTMHHLRFTKLPSKYIKQMII